MSERRQNFHQERVGSNLTTTSTTLHSAIGDTAAYLHAQGFSMADSVVAATARYYNQLYAQTRLLAFMDCFHILGVMTLIFAPLALLVTKARSAKPPEGAH